HARPRHWRECVLWMRLYGYDVRLIPYHTWLAQLDRETAPSGDVTHPLRPLRGFFLARSANGHGRTFPELMLTPAVDDEGEGPRRQHSALDATLLQRYFVAFVSSGVIPAPRERRHSSARLIATSPPTVRLDEAFFARAIGARVT